VWSSDVPAGADASHAVLPDGCIDLLYDATRRDLNVVGTMTSALWVRGCGPSRFVGVRFKPGGAVPFLHERADLLTDQLGDPEVLFGRDARVLSTRLVDAPSNLSCHRRILRDFLLDRLRNDPRPVDRRVAWATAKLTAEPESHVAGVAQDLGLSRQYLRRLFLQEAGVSPKMYARIMRLQRLVGAMPSGRRLVDLAFEAGYADQAHMTNEFRALVGATPQRYRSGVSIPSRPSEAQGVVSAGTLKGEPGCK
jgi:AraC-like DNA-binding protein